MKQILIAALAASVALFVWGGISHTMIIAGVGFTPLPEEDKIVATFRGSLPEQGLFFFPGKSFQQSTPEENMRWVEKYKAGPVGMLIYRPVGDAPISAGKLAGQFLWNLLCGLIIALLLSFIQAGYWRRVGLIVLTGILACAAVSVIYWSWYGFPTSFFLAQCFDIVAGFFIAGVVAARIVGTRMASQS